MTRNTSDSGAVPTPVSSVELGFGEHYFRVEDVSERVQLEVIRGLIATALGALAVCAYSVKRRPHPVDEPIPLS